MSVLLSVMLAVSPGQSFAFLPATPESKEDQQLVESLQNEANPPKPTDESFKVPDVISSLPGLSKNNAESSGDGGSAAVAAKAAAEGDDEAHKGLDEAYEGIKAGLNELIAARKMGESNMPGVVITTPGYEELAKYGSQYVEYRDTCISRQGKAATVCLEHLSEDLHSGAATINTLMSTVGSMAVNDSCSKFSKAMDVAKAALTAYTSACGVMKAGCGWSCVKSRGGLEGMSAALKKASAGASCTPTYPTLAATCQSFVNQYNGALSKLQAEVPKELSTKDKKAVAGKAALCTGKYAILLASAGTGIMSLANSIKQGKECEDSSDGSGSTSVAAADKCADPAKAANDPECICKANPRTPGCANSYQKANEGSLSNLTTGSTGDLSTGATDRNVAGGLTGTNSDSDPFGGAGGSGDSGGGLPGAPMGGGSGLSGFGGGGGGAGGDRGEAAKKGLNTDILSGSGGGGGGGGFGAYRGGGDNKYRQYLPGGEKDPNKAMAGQQAWTKEVTGQAGKSNFEKIKERYRDNKGTLLNN